MLWLQFPAHHYCKVFWGQFGAGLCLCTPAAHLLPLALPHFPCSGGFSPLLCFCSQPSCKAWEPAAPTARPSRPLPGTLCSGTRACDVP